MPIKGQFPLVSSDRDPHEIDADEINVDDAARYGPLGEVMPPGTDPLDVNEMSMKDEGATMGAKALWGRSLVAIGENKVEMNQSSEAQYFNAKTV
jgi:hypothetical protein